MSKLKSRLFYTKKSFKGELTVFPKKPIKIPPEAFNALTSLKQSLGSNTKYRFGIGVKTKSGEFQDLLSLIVYVPEKKPPEQIAPSEMVPSVFEGFPTDVVEARNILITDTDALCGGMEIGHTPINDPTGIAHISSGTLGCVVRRRSDNRRHFLTCEHVVSHRSCDVLNAQGQCAGPNLHDYQYMSMHQPANDSPLSIMGICVEASIELDAAIISPSSSRSISNTIKEIGPVKGKNKIDQLWVPVWKYGKTTGKTNGHVISIVPYEPQPYYLIAGLPSPTRFADHGDSGSAIVNSQQEVVALLFAITDESGTIGLATMIEPICDKLKIDIAVGPIITSITPNSAVITSISPVVIEGFGFDSPTIVTFGGVPAAVLQETPTRLEVLPPPMLVSTVVDVRIENKWGDISENGPTSKFEYLPIV